MSIGIRCRYILKKLTELGLSGKLLDVGAGNGFFVSTAKSSFNVDAVGIEPSKKEVEFAREVLNVEILQENLEYHEGTYEAVTAFNVIEHVTDPVGFLKSLLKKMAPKGLLVLTTPNPRCIHARVHGIEKWAMVDPPHHINLFYRQGLEEILIRHELQIISYETLSTYINFVRKIDSKNLVLRKLFFLILRASRLGADHLIIARKT